MPTEVTGVDEVRKLVYKYPINLHNDAQVIHMPRGANVLEFCNQGPGLVIWVEFFEFNKKDLVPRTFQLFPTGGPIPLNTGYYGTMSRADIQFVVHLYEVYPGEENESG